MEFLRKFSSIKTQSLYYTLNLIGLFDPAIKINKLARLLMAK